MGDPLISTAQIRLASRDDLPALEWGGEFRHYRRLYQEVYRTAENGEALLWVLELDDRGIIGQLFIQLVSARRELADGRSRAYIYGFRIKSAYRGNGLGTHFMNFVERDLRRRGFQQVVLNVRREDQRVRTLYERLGYRVVAAEAGRWSYIDDQGVRQHVHEPSWRMVKELGV